MRINRLHLVLCGGLLCPSACLGQSVEAAAPAVEAKASISGVIRGSNGHRIPEALVTVRAAGGKSDRSATSGFDGTFQIASLAPGSYRLTASKGDAFGRESVVDLAPGQAVVSDLNVPTADPAPVHRKGFVKRLIDAYRDDWKGTASSDPAPKFRGYPGPVDGPPFPFSVWPYGGSVTIGQPWTQAGPLMTAIWGGENGDAWKKSGIQIYGWLNAGVNVSTSKGGGYSNFPEAYAERGNGVELDQEVLYIEKQPDTVQTDHVDWGFRIAALYGLDYRFTTAKGYFSNQLLGKNQENGFDLPMMYVDLYVPQVAQGMDIRVGRYISLPDIEAQLAPNNYTYSHSLLYTFDCYTQTGLTSTTKLSDHWLFQLGVSGGCEAAPWTSDAKVTINTCLGYTWAQGGDNVYACANSINDGHYAYNNMQAYYFTWYHKYGKSKWHTATEGWYQYEKRTPNVNNPAGQALLENGANGAVCNHSYEVTCFAPDFAVLNYQEYQADKHNYISIRNEYMDDMRGQRTGYRTRYSEHLLNWGHWVGTSVLFRPEIRFERSYDAPAYNNGTKKTQITLASDVLFFF